jgi:hypothetical protein
MKIKQLLICFFLMLLLDPVYCQQPGTAKKSVRPIISGSTLSSDDYIVSDFIDINPNPFIDYLSIEILEEGEDIIQIDILSIVGKAVRSISLPAQNHLILNLSDLEKGIYLLKINNGKFSCVKRIIHQ